MKVIVVMVFFMLVMGYSPKASTDPFVFDYLSYFHQMKRGENE